MEPAVSFNNLANFGDRIYLCEVKDNLSLYHYVSCSENDDNLLKQIRGVVFDNTTKQLVLRGFPYTPEYVLKDFAEPPAYNQLKEKLEPTMGSYRFFYSYEGTILRVFYHGEQWHVSTHKRIDAKTSHWGGPVSFEELFRAAVDNIAQHGASFADYDAFFSTLDKAKQYMFLLSCTPQTRIVSTPPPYPVVYLVGVFVDNHFSLDETLDGFQSPLEVKPKDFDELYQMVLKANPMFSQGIVAMSPELGFYKLTSSIYNYLAGLRGNQWNLRLRYLELRYNPEDNSFKDFCRLYSEHAKMFHSIENTIRKIARNIHSAYLRRFVKKQFAVVPSEQYEILRRCQLLYYNTGEPITLETVLSLVNIQHPLTLLRIISKVDN